MLAWIVAFLVLTVSVAGAGIPGIDGAAGWAAKALVVLLFGAFAAALLARRRA